MPPTLDPDRFFNLRTPGAQEWWYFDAVSDDGRDSLVAIVFAGLPFDPSYGMAAKRHLKDPSTHPAPDPLDHCGIAFGWYRPEGSSIRRKGRGSPGLRAMGYALNAHGRGCFEHQADPFRVAVAGNVVERDAQGYRLKIDVLDWDPSRRLSAELRFRPAAGTEAFEADLGGIGSPHHWIVAAADCRVEGRLRIDGPGGDDMAFQGRGYHDHNAGAEELSLAMKRWEWGRVHDEDRTDIYYIAKPRRGPKQALWITCRDGKPTQIRRDPTVTTLQPWANEFFVPYAGALTLNGPEGERLQRWNDHHVDSGPFYQRWSAEFRGPGFRSNRPGIAEQLDTRWLNHPLFNWMIRYRLRRPAPR